MVVVGLANTLDKQLGLASVLVASYPGPSHKRGEGLVYTVVDTQDSARFYCISTLTLLADNVFRTTNPLSDLFVLPYPDHSARCVK